MLYFLLRREDLFSTELAGSAGTQIHSKTINVPAVSEDSMVSSNQIRGQVISVFMSTLSLCTYLLKKEEVSLLSGGDGRMGPSLQ